MTRTAFIALSAFLMGASASVAAVDTSVSRDVLAREDARGRAACGLLRSVVHDVMTMRKADVSEEVMKSVLLHKITSMDAQSDAETGTLSQHAIAWILDANAALLLTSEIRGPASFEQDPEPDVFAAVSEASQILRASQTVASTCHALAAG